MPNLLGFGFFTLKKVMPLNLKNHLPTDKHDTKKAEALVALGLPAIESVLPNLLEWVQDGNWPVACVFLPFLKTVGTPLAPHIRNVFLGSDNTWKYFLLNDIVGYSKELAIELAVDLKRMATTPTSGEISEELDICAKEVLNKFCLGL